MGTRLAQLLAALAVAIACGLGSAAAFAATGDLSLAGCVGDYGGCIATTQAKALDNGTALAISPDGSSVYVVASGMSTGNPGDISTLERNPSTGTLTYEGCSGDVSGCKSTTPANTLENVGALAVSPEGNSVYTSSGAGALDLFSRNTTTGALTYEDCVGSDGSGVGCAHSPINNAFTGLGSIALSPDGTSLYVAGDGGEVLDQFSRNTTTGALTFVGCIGSLSGCTAIPVASDPAQFAIAKFAIAPDGKFLYLANEAFSVINVFARNPATSALTFAGCVGPMLTGCTSTTAPDGGVSSGFAISPDGDNAYTADSIPGGEVDTWSLDQSTGMPTFVSCLGDGVPGCAATSPVNAIYFSESLEISGDGDSVYVGDGSWEDVFARNPSTGALTFQSCIGHNGTDCTATTPTTPPAAIAAITPDGSDLYAIGENALGEYTRTVPPIVCTSASTKVGFERATTVTMHCTDSENEPLTAKIVATPKHGTLNAPTSSGTVVYTPANGYSGTDSFTFTATDAEGTGNTATATLTVGAQPQSTTSARFEDQQISLTAASSSTCTLGSQKLEVKLSSTAIKHSKATKLKFAGAAVYIDKGVKHTKKVRRGKREVTVTTYTANATARRVPATLRLSLKGLKSGKHTLELKLSYKERRNGRTSTVTKTIKATIRVC